MNGFERLLCYSNCLQTAIQTILITYAVVAFVLILAFIYIFLFIANSISTITFILRSFDNCFSCSVCVHKSWRFAIIFILLELFFLCNAQANEEPFSIASRANDSQHAENLVLEKLD